MSIYNAFNSTEAFDKAKWAEQKQAQRSEAYEMIDNTCAKMMEDGNAFCKYLDVQGCFDRYSVANAILVSAQMPKATGLKDYANWKQNRVYVNKDAQKIVILEPGKEYTREDGTKAISFNAKTVYDISQTSAKVKTDDAEQKPMRELVSALIDASPIPFKPIEGLEVAAFYDSSQKMVFVRTDLNEQQLFTAMSKEVAAAVYDFKYKKSRDVSDFKSFCVAYMLSSKYGVDTKGFKFDKLPEELSSLKSQAFRNELESMRGVLSEINSVMYKSLEKNKSTKSKEQER